MYVLLRTERIDKETDRICMGVFKTFESAIQAMMENRIAWKEDHYVFCETLSPISIEYAPNSGVQRIMDIEYDILPVQKIEA